MAANIINVPLMLVFLLVGILAMSHVNGDAVRRAQCSDVICWEWGSFTNSKCHLEPPAPGKCCATPRCPPNIGLRYASGYKDE